MVVRMLVVDVDVRASACQRGAGGPGLRYTSLYLL